MDELFKRPLPLRSFVMTQRVFSTKEALSNLGKLTSLFDEKHSLPVKIKRHYGAFIHSSFVQEFKGSIESNERPEFLGDTVLNLLISKMLFLKYPNLDEGKLSKLRASLVNEEGLYDLAISSDLHRFIVLGKGGLNNQEKKGPIADLVEALLGHVYIKEGLDSAEQLLKAFLANYKKKTKENYIRLDRLDFFDPKSKLQEKVLAHYGRVPEYNDREIGRGFYQIDLVIAGKKVLAKKGRSKKKVQRELAGTALEKHLYR